VAADDRLGLLLAKPIDKVRELLKIGAAPQYTRYAQDPAGHGLVREDFVA
jgi:hypothetical protein